MAVSMAVTAAVIGLYGYSLEQSYIVELKTLRSDYEKRVMGELTLAVTGMGEEGLSWHTVNSLHRMLADGYSAYGESGVISIDGKPVTDSSESAFVQIWYYGHLEVYRIRDINDLSGFDEWYEGFLEARGLTFRTSEYACMLNSVYIDRENGIFIPCRVDVYEREWIETDTGTEVVRSVDVDDPIGDMLDSYECSPENTDGFEFYDIPDGHVQYSNIVHYGDRRDGTSAAQPPEYGGIIDSMVVCDSNGDLHTCNIKWYEPDSVVTPGIGKTFGMLPYVLAMAAAAAAALVFSYLSYARAKSVYDMYEYRRKMTDALAHDLKTPLSVISAYAENLREDVNSGKRTYYSDRIIESVGNMNRLIDNTLSFSKITGGKLRLKTERLDIGALAREICEEQTELFERRQITVLPDVKVRFIRECDRELMRQALSNLIANVAFHAEEGTVASVTSSEDSLVIENRTDDTITDVSRLCEPFVKGDASRGDKGSGLGLAVAKEDLEAMGFKLSIECIDGTFRVRIHKG